MIACYLLYQATFVVAFFFCDLAQDRHQVGLSSLELPPFWGP
jgi:hypothetical protein